ncbi:MAG: hypothetical protein MPW15_17420 [Candidatus Manganitrophus sp.]|nr:hypothetical protein [Candidatus Manganitrophus sp.]
MDNPLFDLLGEGEVGLDGVYRLLGEMRLAESVTQKIRSTPVGSLLPMEEEKLEVPIEIAGTPQGARLALREEALKGDGGEAASGKTDREAGKRGIGRATAKIAPPPELIGTTSVRRSFKRRRFGLHCRC